MEVFFVLWICIVYKKDDGYFFWLCKFICVFFVIFFRLRGRRFASCLHLFFEKKIDFIFSAVILRAFLWNILRSVEHFAVPTSFFW
jgi:hypothetical protein